MAALHTDYAVEINRPNRAAPFLEYSPRPLLYRALENAHARRGGGEGHMLRADAHRPRCYFTGLDLADFVAALAGAHFRGSHRGGADPMGILINLYRHFDIVGRGAKLDR